MFLKNMDIVYKFRDWSNKNHQKILTNNMIYLAPPNKINDPFDCHINENFSLLSEKEFERYIDDQISYFQLMNSDKVRERIKNKYTTQEKLQNDYVVNCKNIGIFSCCQDSKTEKAWQNILLWSHYSNEHKGFCVAFWKQELFKYFTTQGKIKYGNYPKLKPYVPIKKNKKKIVKNLITLISTKEKRWQYEREYRFIKINTDISSEIGLTKENRIINVSNDCFAGVFLGANISPRHEREIFVLCNQKKIPVFKIIPKPFDFSLTNERIYELKIPNR